MQKKIVKNAGQNFIVVGAVQQMPINKMAIY